VCIVCKHVYYCVCVCVLADVCVCVCVLQLHCFFFFFFLHLLPSDLQLFSGSHIPSCLLTACFLRLMIHTPLLTMPTPIPFLGCCLNACEIAVQVVYRTFARFALALPHTHVVGCAAVVTFTVGCQLRCSFTLHVACTVLRLPAGDVCCCLRCRYAVVHVVVTFAVPHVVVLHTTRSHLLQIILCGSLTLMLLLVVFVHSWLYLPFPATFVPLPATLGFSSVAFLPLLLLSFPACHTARLRGTRRINTSPCLPTAPALLLPSALPYLFLWLRSLPVLVLPVRYSPHSSDTAGYHCDTFLPYGMRVRRQTPRTALASFQRCRAYRLLWRFAYTCWFWDRWWITRRRTPAHTLRFGCRCAAFVTHLTLVYTPFPSRASRLNT